MSLEVRFAFKQKDFFHLDRKDGSVDTVKLYSILR